MKKDLKNTITLKGDKKVIRGWVIYDWANSAYQLTIATVIFPFYFLSVTTKGSNDVITFFGHEVINSVIYSWSVAMAYFIVAGLTPLLSSLADYTGRRKSFMKFFTWLGALSCGSLFFFDSNFIEIGIIGFTLATLGYGGSLVYYNSFLPVIAEKKDQDKISARGYSLGYLGGVVLLMFNLLMVMKPEIFGITSSTLPAKISFVTVGLWWIGFAQITFNRLPKYTYRKRRKDKETNIFFEGYAELNKVFQKVRKSRKLTTFLLGFFFIMMGLITTMFMAPTYAEKEIGIVQDTLIPILIGIQLIGMAGAWFFSRLSAKIGNLKALIISVTIWILVCSGASAIVNATEFVLAAFFIGIVMGGTQSLARSTYSKMIPTESTEHTSYFSFYDVMEKLASVAGTFTFGLIEALTGSMRYSVAAIAIFFVIGAVFLSITLYFEVHHGHTKVEPVKV